MLVFAGFPYKALLTMVWTVHTREVEGRPAQVLIDDQFAAQAPVKDLIRLSGFSLYCKQEPINSLWHPDEGAALDLIEEHLIDLCEKHSHGWCLYVLRLATFGVREYFMYHSDEAELSQAYAGLRELHPDYRIEFATISDPDWKQYLSYVQTASTARD
jgi:hypothetical protein